MNNFCSRREKSRFWVVLLVVAILLLIPGPANAAIYDDFNGVGIDHNKWEIIGTGFSQPGDGYLHFFYRGSEGHSLVSKGLYASGIFSMAFKDYKCDNRAPGGKGLGSIAGFGLGSKSLNNWVRIMRGQIRSGGYIEVNWVVPNEPNHPIHVNWIASEIKDGFLQIHYDGKAATFFFRAKETDAWRQMPETDPDGHPSSRPLILRPGWGAKVPMFIIAFPGGQGSDNYTLSFKVDNVDVQN
jgi:hypothetical protein